MYLSQLVLNPQTHAVQDDLSDPYQLHRTVMSGFPKELPTGERVLFRLEMQRSKPYLILLVQSYTLPNWGMLEQRGYLLRPVSIKEYEFHPFIDQKLRFRITANPTKRLRTEGNGTGKRIGLEREEDQLAWLYRKGEQNGFKVLTVQTVKIDQPDGWKIEDGKKLCIRQFTVRFDGLLQVTDADTFAQAWAQGIGSGKGMGCGLLSLASA